MVVYPSQRQTTPPDWRFVVENTDQTSIQSNHLVSNSLLRINWNMLNREIPIKSIPMVTIKW